MTLDTAMLMEILAIMFIPSILINSLSWILIVRYMEKKDKKLRDDTVAYVRNVEKTYR